MSVAVMFEEFFEAVAKSLTILFFFLNDFLDFQQVVLVINFFLTNLAKTELRTSWALISDTYYWLCEASFALNSFVDQSFWFNFLDLMIQYLLLEARNQCLDSLVNKTGNSFIEVVFHSLECSHFIIVVMMSPLFLLLTWWLHLLTIFFFNNNGLLHLFHHGSDLNYFSRFFFRLFNYRNNYFSNNFFFHKGIDLSCDVDLDIIFSFEDGLHDIDIIVAEYGDVIIIFIEEWDVKWFWDDVELFADEVDDFVVGEGVCVELDVLVELKN